MRIAQIMAGAPQGGAEAFYERLTIALHGAGDTLLPVIRSNAARAGRLRCAGLEPRELRFGGPFDLLTGPRLALALRRFAPEVAIAWMNRAASFAPRGPWKLVGRLGGYYKLRHYRACDHLVANTHDIRRWVIEQGWPRAGVTTVPNFADDLAGAAPAALPGAGGPLLLAMGRLHPNKGFDMLLRALPLVPEATLCIAGEGPERAELEALAREIGVAARTHFLGWREDRGALLAACDLFVCPSRHEPLGNVLLEAWSAARPVLAAAAQGPMELLEPDQDGVLVPLEDPGALGRAMRALLADAPRRAALAAAGRARFAASFAEAPVLAQWRGFLGRIAGGAA